MKTTFSEAADRLATSRPWRETQPVNAWPGLSPWAMMTAIWCGWAMAHVAVVVLL